MAKGGTTSYAIRRMRTSRKADAEQWSERRRICAHALLNRPWITKDADAELFYWIKDQYAELRDWFNEYTGFLLILTRTLAKLDKSPVKAETWMGMNGFKEVRDYTFFTYALWFLEGKSELEQFVLTDIVEQVSEQMTVSGVTIDWENYQQRLSMVRALKKLRELGVLVHIDGDETEWAHTGQKNVLYECEPSARYVLRHFPRDVRHYGEIDEYAEMIVYPETADGELRKRRHRVFRRFLLEPAIADKDWHPDDLYYVITQRRTIIDNLQFMFGLEGTRYREGLYFFHPELTGECGLFPTAAGISDLALLFAGELRRNLDAKDWYVTELGTIELTLTDVEGLLHTLKLKFGEYWSSEHRSMALGDLSNLLTTHMSEWGLGRWQDREHGNDRERFIVSAVLSRWNAHYSLENEDSSKV